MVVVAVAFVFSLEFMRKQNDLYDEAIVLYNFPEIYYYTFRWIKWYGVTEHEKQCTQRIILFVIQIYYSNIVNQFTHYSEWNDVWEKKEEDQRFDSSAAIDYFGTFS